MFGGDQLTVARIRGTQALRNTQDKASDHLQGLIPVVEDWHSRMPLVDVSWFFTVFGYLFLFCDIIHQ